MSFCFGKIGIFLTALAPLTALGASAPAASRPNIIFILADDLGLPGIGCCGGKFQTPQIDALAAGGLRFERAYAAPLCAPSRALCMFGRYAFRTGVLSNGCGAAARPDAEVCIAKVMKQAGYATAVAGKWRQLSYFSTPEDGKAWGWDEFLIWGVNKQGTGNRYWDPDYNHNGKPLANTQSKFGPDLLHQFVIDFIGRHRQEPFFIYYPTTLIHGKLFPTPDSAGKADVYADNIAYMDQLVGKLVAELDRLQLREKTLIVFTGDNGSVRNASAEVRGRPVEGHKGSLLEGGSRVPLIAQWKGTTPTGKVLTDLVGFSDFFATFAELGGAQLPAGVTFDSHSFAPQLRGQSGQAREWLYIQLGAHWYVRNEGWKLDERGQLFDLKDAPFKQAPVSVADQSPAAQAARAQLQSVLDKLDPAGGVVAQKRTKTDGGDKKAKRERRRGKKGARSPA